MVTPYQKPNKMKTIRFSFYPGGLLHGTNIRIYKCNPPAIGVLIIGSLTTYIAYQDTTSPIFLCKVLVVYRM